MLDSHVPARYVKNGYTILSADGRVLEVVPRALTEEEIRARDRMLAAQQQKEKLKQEQKIADQNLLRIYSTPEDVIRARDTKITSIDNFIRTSQGNLQRLESQKRNLESTLANIERAGGTIPEDPLNRIRHVETSIRTTEREIVCARLATVETTLRRSGRLVSRPTASVNRQALRSKKNSTQGSPLRIPTFGW